MASNIEGENERVGVIRQPANELGQSNNLVQNQELKSEKIPNEESKNVESVNKTVIENQIPQANPQFNQPFYGMSQMPSYTNRRHDHRRRLKKKRKNRPQYQNYQAQYAYAQSYGYPQYSGYNQWGYTQSYPGYSYGYPQAQSYPASPQLSVYNSQCNTYDEMQNFRKLIRKYQNLRRLSVPIQTRTSLLRCSKFWQELCKI